MFLKDATRALFAFGQTSSGRSSIEPLSTRVFSEYTEPSPAMRAAVRRQRLGLPKQATPGSGQAFSAPSAYNAHPVHKRASTRAGLASSDALILTRFLLSGAETRLSRLLGGEVENRNVLDFDLGGLELAWHSDLMRSLEDRAAIWSVSRLVLPSGDLVLEHLVMPGRIGTGQLSFVGWFHRIGGNLDGDPVWSDVISVGREQRSQRISGRLPEDALPDLASPEAERRQRGDLVSEFRAKGAL